MDLPICINSNSFPASSHQQGDELMLAALQGVLQLVEGNERVLFYYDSNEQPLLDLQLAQNYTYEDFRESCNDVDLQAFLYEVEDKSPALDALTDAQFEEIAEYDLYIPDQPLDSHRDVYALAWILNGYLLSLATDERWSKPEVQATQQGEQGQYKDEFVTLKNISCINHGQYFFAANAKIDFAEVISPHSMSNELQEWISQQSKENQQIILNKLKLAVARSFQGGGPLFKSLITSGSLREIRFSAFSGGAIRILFSHYYDTNYLLLNGFIKHDDNEGYKQNIALAEEILTNFITDNKQGH